MANDSLEDYKRRNERMLKRYNQRSKSQKIEELMTELIAAKSIENNDEKIDILTEKYALYASNEGKMQYLDYYESDKEEIEMFELVSKGKEEMLILMFENHNKNLHPHRGYFTIPKRQHNKAFGFWKNFLYDYKDFNEFIAPKAKQMINVCEKINSLPNAESAVKKVEDKSIGDKKKEN